MRGMEMWHYKRRSQTRRLSFNSLVRRGATVVEAAVAGTLVLLMILMVIQSAVAISAYNSLSVVARTTARQVIVRGEKSAAQQPAWGPGRIQLAASHSHAIAELARRHLTGVRPHQVALVVEWPEGTNRVGSEVRVQVTMPRTALPTMVRWMYPDQLQAVSRMQIQH